MPNPDDLFGPELDFVLKANPTTTPLASALEIASLLGEFFFQEDKVVPKTYNEYVFSLATEAQASEADMALWTNRVPMHEPWPRVLKGMPMKDESSSQAYDDVSNMLYQNVTPQQRYNLNRHHSNEFPDDSAWVGRAEGDQLIERGKLWRR